MQRVVNPYENQGTAAGYIVEDPRQPGGYYSTATLPSSASLRKASGIPTSGYQVVQPGQSGARAISEPRNQPKKLTVPATSTLDRYTLMAANAARSKSAERVPMKYRRASMQEPSGYHQGYSVPVGNQNQQQM